MAVLLPSNQQSDEKRNLRKWKTLNMFNARKRPYPKTTEECKRRLKILESKVKEARTNPFKQSEEELRPDFEILYRNRCKKSLSWFEEEHMNSPNIFEKKLAKMARKYRECL